MRLEADKKAFLSYLDQFDDDVPFQLDLAEKIIKLMPAQVMESFITDIYFSKVFKGEYYYVRHKTYKCDEHYFTNIVAVKEFLVEHNGMKEMTDTVLRSLSATQLVAKCMEGGTICGYIVERRFK